MKRRERVKILSNKEIGKGIFDLRLLVDFGEEVQPGQFINVYTNDKSLLLPRPISVCDCEGDELRLIYKVVGKGTKVLADYTSGDFIDITTPLGNGNMIYTDKNHRRLSNYDGKKVLLVGGGIGCPPMLLLAKKLKKMGAKVDVVLAFRDEVILEEDFKQLGVFLHIATEEATVGFKGNAIDLIRDKHLLDDVSEVFSCGPKGMLKALGDLSIEKDITCQLSLEERMGCGFGACAGCICHVKEKIEDGKGGFIEHKAQKGVCKVGPVFYADEIDWEA